jgi:hypothetical protein
VEASAQDKDELAAMLRTAWAITASWLRTNDDALQQTDAKKTAGLYDSRNAECESDWSLSMSDLTFLEKRKFEQFLGMATGYVLDFSNRTFAEFVLDSTGRDIYDSRYEYASGSKANRLRAFWQKEENAVVGKLMSDMLDCDNKAGPLKDGCRLIIARLLHGSPVPQWGTDPQNKEQSSQRQRRAQILGQLKEDFLQLAPNVIETGLGWPLKNS